MCTCPAQYPGTVPVSDSQRRGQSATIDNRDSYIHIYSYIYNLIYGATVKGLMNI